MNKELLKQALDVIEGLFYGREDLDREGIILTVEGIEKELAKHETLKREPLSDDEIKAIRLEIPSSFASINFARAIEKAHGIGE